MGTAYREGAEDAAKSVHPHASGDSWTPANSADVVAGSPPREWGQLLADGEHGALDRFTPTRVGTACNPAYLAPSPLVHPHASGDSPCCMRRDVLLCGSPPREWGQLAAFWALFNPAGSPPREWGQPIFKALHEGRARFTPTRVGQRLLAFNEWLTQRFTPTRVGTASPVRRRTSAGRVHPHASGDSYQGVVEWQDVCGSPPREWGQHFACLVTIATQRFTPREWGQHMFGNLRFPRLRFTPTRVGTAVTWNTLPLRNRFTPTRVGTAHRARPCSPKRRGSPPREWGQLITNRVAWINSGFTPTRVGTADPVDYGRNLSWVHPHASGDSAS